MESIDYIVIAVIVSIIIGAAVYNYRAKKSGKKCVGCPSAGGCSGKCGSCAGCCGKNEQT